MPLRLVTGSGGPGGDRPARSAAGGVLGPAWLIGPAAPVTVLGDPTVVLGMRVAAGRRGEARFVVENHQATAALIRPMLSPLTGRGGSRWSPASEVVPDPVLVMPGEQVEATLWVDVPAATSAGTYTGTLVVVGTTGRTAVTVVVVDDDG